MTAIPPDAITAAAKAIHCDPDTTWIREEDCARAAIEAALPFLPNPAAIEAEAARAEGAAAILDRIASLASQLHADFPADEPQGARASFADYLRINRDSLLDGPQ